MCMQYILYIPNGWSSVLIGTSKRLRQQLTGVVAALVKNLEAYYQNPNTYNLVAACMVLVWILSSSSVWLSSRKEKSMLRNWKMMNSSAEGLQTLQEHLERTYSEHSSQGAEDYQLRITFLE